MTPLHPLKHVADVRFSNVDKKTVDGQIAVKLCNYTDVYYNEQIVAEMPFMEASASADQVAKFSLRAGDVLLTKDSETADDIGVSAHVPEDLPGVLCGYHLAIARPRPSAVDGRYLRWALAATASRQQLEVAATGVTRFGLRQDAVAGMLVPVPALPEQRAIADYLDAETARIGELVDRHERLVALLRERRGALIRVVTTRGSSSGPSYVPDVWPPAELPEGWSRVRIRHLARVRRGASPRPIDDPVYFDSEGTYGWVRISDVTASGRYLESTEQRLSELGASRSVRLEPGRLILSIAASVGYPIITRIPCCIHDGFVYFDGLESLEPEYLYYLFLGGGMFEGLGKLGTQLNLNTDTIGDILMPVPPHAEQVAIVRRLDADLGAIDSATSAIGNQIQLLLERRRALLTAAVTGQLEIPGVAA